MAFVNQNPILQSLIAEQLVSDPSSARGRLLNEAARLFRDKGYERTTVRDLAAAVGIQSGSLFHHFRTKEEILKAVMVETIRAEYRLDAGRCRPGGFSERKTAGADQGRTGVD